MNSNLGQDLFSAATLENPYELYAALHEQAPVQKVTHPVSGSDVYLITSFKHVTEVLQSPQRFSSSCGDLMYGGLGGHSEANEILAQGYPTRSSMQLSDDPEHQMHRSLVSGVFTPARIGKLSEFIETAADELIDAFIEKGECDFIEQYAAPLPIYVIGSMLGIERSVWSDLRRWSDAYVVRLSQTQTLDEDIAAAHAIVELQRYFMASIQDRRENPRDDLLSDLVKAAQSGKEPLADTDLLAIIEQIAVGGAESSRNTIAGGLALLLKNPEQMAILQKDRSLTANAAEEILRYYTAVSGIWRRTLEETELGGVTIPSGAAVLLRFDASNRDDQQFENASAFDVTRPNARRHLGFGGGIHHCLGHMLARKELTASLDSILGRMHNIRVDFDRSDLSHHASLLQRVTRRLIIHFEPGTPLGGTANFDAVERTASKRQ